MANRHGAKRSLPTSCKASVGRENVTQLRTKFLGDRFETFRFLKKTLLVGVDVEPDFLSTKGASVLKGLVGGDWFDAEQKAAAPVVSRFRATFCALVTSNTRLRLRLKGDVGAWRRRLLIVRYEAPAPKKRIPDFGALLVREEGTGILNWCIAGLDMVLRDIDQAQRRYCADRPAEKASWIVCWRKAIRCAVFLRERVEKAAGALIFRSTRSSRHMRLFVQKWAGGRCRLPRFTLRLKG